MLVLTRRIGDEIVINGHIRLKVTVAQGERVRFGIVAPREVRVDRAEVRRQQERGQDRSSS